MLSPIPGPLGFSSVDLSDGLLSVSWLRFFPGLAKSILHVCLLSSCQDFVAIVFPPLALSLWVMPFFKKSHNVVLVQFLWENRS